jgi:polyisoprenoid-binding protein YceI
VKWRRAMGVAAVVVGLAGLVPGAVPLPGETYKVDTVHSTAIYRVQHMKVGHLYGRFNDISGTFTIDEQAPEKSAFDLKVAANSLDSANPKRDQHLKGPDFLNAKQFPTISFKSKKVSKLGAGGFTVEGDLTLHGVTRPVTVKVENVVSGGQRAGLEATFEFKRSDFGMTGMLDMVGDQVKMIVSLEGTHS